MAHRGNVTHRLRMPVACLRAAHQRNVYVIVIVFMIIRLLPDQAILGKTTPCILT